MIFESLFIGAQRMDLIMYLQTPRRSTICFEKNWRVARLLL